jgi:hypothetical protein
MTRSLSHRSWLHCPVCTPRPFHNPQGLKSGPRVFVFKFRVKSVFSLPKSTVLTAFCHVVASLSTNPTPLALPTPCRYRLHPPHAHSTVSIDTPSRTSLSLYKTKSTGINYTLSLSTTLYPHTPLSLQIHRRVLPSLSTKRKSPPALPTLCRYRLIYLHYRYLPIVCRYRPLPRPGTLST